MTQQDDVTPTAGRFLANPWVKVGLYAVGVALLAGAIYMVVRDRETLSRALDNARDAPWWKFAILLAGALLNWIFSSAMFTVLTRRYADIKFGEMLWLIGASWLLNYLPMRPGLVARVAYLNTVRGISIRDLAKIGVQSAACTIAGAGIIAEIAILQQLAGQPVRLVSYVLLVALVCGVALGFLRVRAGDGKQPWTIYSVSLGFRLLDMLTQALRIWLAFDIIGHPIAAPEALLLAGPAQIVGLMPVQLGTVEWTVGLLAKDTPSGAAAALLNRAADLLVALPVGLASVAWLWRCRSRNAALGGPAKQTPGK